MPVRFLLLCTLASVLAVPATASAQTRTAPEGPACTHAAAQRSELRDAAGDHGAAPDLLELFVDVREDCSVTITYGLDDNVMAPGDSLSLGVDTDADTGSGLPDGADRVLTVSGAGASLGVVDPATGGASALVSPQPTMRAAAERLIVVEMTVAALGLLPGRPARLSFASAFRADGISHSDSAPAVELKVDFGAVLSESGAASQPARPALRGTARVGRTLTCSGPKGARYTWLRDGRAVRGATKRALKLRTTDAGRRIACRVKVAGGAATSKAVKVLHR